MREYEWMQAAMSKFLSLASVQLIQFSRSVVSDSLRPGTAAWTLRLPVCHQLWKFTQSHVHWVGNAIQPSHPLLSPSPAIFNLCQHQGLFWWVSSSHQVAKYWSFSFSINPSNEHPGPISLGWTGWISLQSKGLSRVFSNTTVQKHQFFHAQLFSPSNSHIHTWLLEKP